jgi:phosphoribosylaminoimidazole carboxylase PurK protein/phosphoribosylaminoimidazole carboxylase PurE protein
VNRTGPRLGIVGGGQLARMIARAASQLGCETLVLAREGDVPAAGSADRVLVGDWDDPRTLARLARQVDVVTLENEFVDAAALGAAEAAGHRVFPTPASLSRVQDKLRQKEALRLAGLPVAPYRAVGSPEQVCAAALENGFPLVLKARRNGYDGKGNFTIRHAGQVDQGWLALGGGGNELLVEAFVPFVRELAVIVTRGPGGDTAVYPLVESIQRDHICHEVIAPAEVPAEVSQRATQAAIRAVAAVGGVGSFGVEMFLTQEGGIVVNELAPRVHNSGHYTIEGCECSQFENHVRAVFGWPLGRPSLLAPAVAMVNLIGTARGAGNAAGLDKALAVPGAHVHLYGKRRSEVGRKMGHVTALAGGRVEALEAARRSAGAICFGWGAFMSAKPKPQVGIVMGSVSDWPTLEAAAAVCGELGVPCEVSVKSAHRTPDAMAAYAKSARRRGLRVIIAGAGGAAHLPGMVAAHTPLPVIGVPVESRHLHGLDSLLSIAQMPAGVPVATVPIGAGRHAGLLAVSILAASDRRLRERLLRFKAVLAADGGSPGPLSRQRG